MLNILNIFRSNKNIKKMLLRNILTEEASIMCLLFMQMYGLGSTPYVLSENFKTNQITIIRP